MKLTAVIGRNGAGKTTWLNTMLRTRAFGDVEVALVPQEHIFPPEMLLRDFLRLAYLPAAGLFGKVPVKAKDEVEEMLSAFGLTALADRPLGKISTGERQRAFLSRALLQQPKVLLLDEPTNHLDPAAVEDFWELLLKRRSESPFDVFVSTHDLRFVRGHADWIRALDAGHIVYDGESKAFWSGELIEKVFGRRINVD